MCKYIKIYKYGGNINSCYLNDIHSFDLQSWTHSKIEAKFGAESLDFGVTISSEGIQHANLQMVIIKGLQISTSTKWKKTRKTHIVDLVDKAQVDGGRMMGLGGHKSQKHAKQGSYITTHANCISVTRRYLHNCMNM